MTHHVLIGTPSPGYFWCWRGSKKAQTHPVPPCTQRRRMSEAGSKSSQPLASKQEKDGTEKRGRGRLRKQPSKEPSEVPTPQRPRGRPKGSKNKGHGQDKESQHNSRTEIKGQTQETGEGGRGGHLPGVLGGGAVTNHSACCSLATKEQLSLGTGSTAPRPLPALTAHYRTRHSCRLCSAAPTGAGFSSVPVPSSPTHLPPPDKANFPFSRARPAVHLPHSSLGALFCESLLPCCSWPPCRGSWEHSLALRGPSPISF